MKRWIVLGGGTGVAAMAAAVVWYARDPASSKVNGEAAGKTASPLHRLGEPQRDGPVVYDVDALLEDGSPDAWGKIASLYPGSDEETKRKVLQRIAKLPELHRVIGYLLATVGEDPTPAASDPMIAEAAELLKSHWKKPDDFDYARRTMVMQKTDKRRWVLANALAAFAKDHGVGSPFYALKGALGAKLIDMHSQIQDPFIKNAIVDRVDALGSKDAAVILARGPDVTDEELQAVSERKANVDAVLRNAQAR